ELPDAGDDDEVEEQFDPGCVPLGYAMILSGHNGQYADCDRSERPARAFSAASPSRAANAVLGGDPPASLGAANHHKCRVMSGEQLLGRPGWTVGRTHVGAAWR